MSLANLAMVLLISSPSMPCGSVLGELGVLGGILLPCLLMFFIFVSLFFVLELGG